MKPYYEHAGITIYHGDCREILLTLGPVDLVLTDPPYGIGVTRMTLGNGNRQVFRGSEAWDDSTPDLSWVISSGLPAIVWGGNYFQLPPSRCWFVWDKGTGSNDFADCELAWTNLDSTVRKYFQSWVGANAKESYDKDRFHPTQKPVGLMKWCLNRLGDGLILDPFMGSGTTLVAAKNLNRRAIGIEIEERYCEIAAKRLQQEVLDLSA